MPNNRQCQLSLLARLPCGAEQRSVLSAEQRQQLARLLAELLLKAARLAATDGEQEVHDERTD
jgi:hypothetical protein